MSLTRRTRRASRTPKAVVALTIHERPPSMPAPAAPPKTDAEWAALRMKDAKTLRELGLRPWCDPNDPEVFWPHKETLHLFPGEWYGDIPDGFEVVDILGRPLTFELGKTDDDIRGGCLAYGILVEVK